MLLQRARAVALDLLALALPVTALAVGGALLWRRLRSLATLLVALGFTATLLGQVVELLTSIELSSMMRTYPDSTFFIAYHHGFPVLAHYVGLVGLWTAAAGLIWHAATPLPPASPSGSSRDTRTGGSHSAG